LETLRRDYGMVICDGVCQVDALTLMRVVRTVGARYLLGLAAGPVREDGLHRTLSMAMGGVVLRMASDHEQPKTLRLTLRTRATEFDFPGYEGRRQYQALVAALAGDRPRAELVVDEVVREARAGHPCLVLSERRDHLELLVSLLPDDLEREAITSTVRPAERQRIISRFESGELTVLLATSQIAAETLVTPRLQRVFLTFPFSYARKLERVVRSGLMAPTAGQQRAVLYDYDDPKVEPLHRAFKKRSEAFNKLRRESDRKAQLELPLGR
jgi:superfamily II DNA or RNA helicase